MKTLTAKKTVSIGLSLIYFTTQIAFGNQAESAFWAERRKAVPQQMAALPAAAPLPPPIVPSFTPLKKTARATGPQWGLLQTHLTVQDIHDAGEDKEPPVVIVQDVHMNNEAQTNIAAALRSLIENKQARVIGVEGAFGNFDFSPFRELDDQQAVRAVAQEFFNDNRLAAPSYVGLTGGTETRFIGVDDRAHYDANVKAYLDSRRTKPYAVKKIEETNRRLQHEKQKIFSPALKRFDDARTAYRAGSLGLGKYVGELARSEKFAPHPTLRRFQEAYRLEQSLDFQKVESERKTVLEKLARHLTKEETANLVAGSLAYRNGQVGLGRYYADLRELLDQKGIALHQTPVFEEYLRYVLLSDGLKANALFDEIESVENAIAKALAATPEQKKLLAESEHLGLARKLTEFALTPKEWGAYRQSIDHSPWTMDQKLSSFESFYEQADIRSHKMVKNARRADVLVVGGFHTPLITQILREQKRSYVVLSPKITKIDTADGSAYLSVFAREKTPLEKLLSGEKLFLAVEKTQITHPATKLQFCRRLLANLNWATRWKVTRYAFLVLLMPALETMLFQTFGLTQLQSATSSFWLAGSIIAGLFVLAHVAIDIARGKPVRKKWKNYLAGYFILGVLSVVCSLPFLRMDPATATLIATLPHISNNLIKILFGHRRWFPRWWPLASVLPERREFSPEDAEELILLAQWAGRNSLPYVEGVPGFGGQILKSLIRPSRLTGQVNSRTGEATLVVEEKNFAVVKADGKHHLISPDHVSCLSVDGVAVDAAGERWIFHAHIANDDDPQFLGKEGNAQGDLVDFIRILKGDNRFFKRHSFRRVRMFLSVNSALPGLQALPGRSPEESILALQTRLKTQFSHDGFFLEFDPPLLRGHQGRPEGADAQTHALNTRDFSLTDDRGTLHVGLDRVNRRLWAEARYWDENETPWSGEVGDDNLRIALFFQEWAEEARGLPLKDIPEAAGHIKLLVDNGFLNDKDIAGFLEYIDRGMADPLEEAMAFRAFAALAKEGLLSTEHSIRYVPVLMKAVVQRGPAVRALATAALTDLNAAGRLEEAEKRRLLKLVRTQLKNPLAHKDWDLKKLAQSGLIGPETVSGFASRHRDVVISRKTASSVIESLWALRALADARLFNKQLAETMGPHLVNFAAINGVPTAVQMPTREIITMLIEAKLFPPSEARPIALEALAGLSDPDEQGRQESLLAAAWLANAGGWEQSDIDALAPSLLKALKSNESRERTIASQTLARLADRQLISPTSAAQLASALVEAAGKPQPIVNPETVVAMTSFVEAGLLGATKQTLPLRNVLWKAPFGDWRASPFFDAVRKLAHHGFFSKERTSEALPYLEKMLNSNDAYSPSAAVEVIFILLNAGLLDAGAMPRMSLLGPQTTSPLREGSDPAARRNQAQFIRAALDAGLAAPSDRRLLLRGFLTDLNDPRAAYRKGAMNALKALAEAGVIRPSDYALRGTALDAVVKTRFPSAPVSLRETLAGLAASTRLSGGWYGFLKATVFSAKHLAGLGVDNLKETIDMAREAEWGPSIASLIASSGFAGVRLFQIQFWDEGDAVNNFPAPMKFLLNAMPAVPIARPADFPLPSPVSSAKTEIVDFDPQGEFDLTRPTAMDGRTLIYETPSERTFHLKLLKRGEKTAALAREHDVMNFLRAKKNEWGLLGEYPRGIARLARLPLKDMTVPLIAANKGRSPEPDFIDMDGGRLLFMVYETLSQGPGRNAYRTYLNDPDLSEEEFLEALRVNVHDRMVMARHGLFDLEIIELFHNRENGHSRRYDWMVDAFHHQDFREGAGRLDDFVGATLYPNLRLSGPADLAELYFIDDLTRQDRFRQLSDGRLNRLRTLGKLDPEKTRRFAVAAHMGDTLLSLALMAPTYLLRRRELSYEKETERTDTLLQKSFSVLFKEAALALRGDAANLPYIDPQQMARQTAYFTTDRYRRDFQEKRNLPADLYPETMIGNRAVEFVEGRGWTETGWNIRRAQHQIPSRDPAKRVLMESADLGPVNGPNPLQELVRAMYLFIPHQMLVAAAAPAPLERFFSTLDDLAKARLRDENIQPEMTSLFNQVRSAIPDEAVRRFLDASIQDDNKASKIDDFNLDPKNPSFMSVLLGLSYQVLNDPEAMSEKQLAQFENVIETVRKIGRDPANDKIQFGYFSLPFLLVLSLSPYFSDSVNYIRLSKNIKRLPGVYGIRAMTVNFALTALHLSEKFYVLDWEDLEAIVEDIEPALRGMENPLFPQSDRDALKEAFDIFLLALAPQRDQSMYLWDESIERDMLKMELNRDDDEVHFLSDRVKRVRKEFLDALRNSRKSDGGLFLTDIQNRVRELQRRSDETQWAPFPWTDQRVRFFSRRLQQLPAYDPAYGTLEKALLFQGPHPLFAAMGVNTVLSPLQRGRIERLARALDTLAENRGKLSSVFDPLFRRIANKNSWAYRGLTVFFAAAWETAAFHFGLFDQLGLNVFVVAAIFAFAHTIVEWIVRALDRHPGESRNPGLQLQEKTWAPAFAGATKDFVSRFELSLLFSLPFVAGWFDYSLFNALAAFALHAAYNAAVLTLRYFADRDYRGARWVLSVLPLSSIIPMEKVAKQITENQTAFLRYALTLTHNPDDALDLVQKASLKALRFVEKGPLPKSFKTWFQKIILNAFRAEKRTAASKRLVLFEEGAQEKLEAGLTEASPDPETIAFWFAHLNRWEQLLLKMTEQFEFPPAPTKDGHPYTLEKFCKEFKKWKPFVVRTKRSAKEKLKAVSEDEAVFNPNDSAFYSADHNDVYAFETLRISPDHPFFEDLIKEERPILERLAPRREDFQQIKKWDDFLALLKQLRASPRPDSVEWGPLVMSLQTETMSARDNFMMARLGWALAKATRDNKVLTDLQRSDLDSGAPGRVLNALKLLFNDGATGEMLMVLAETAGFSVHASKRIVQNTSALAKSRTEKLDLRSSPAEQVRALYADVRRELGRPWSATRPAETVLDRLQQALAAGRISLTEAWMVLYRSLQTSEYLDVNAGPASTETGKYEFVLRKFLGSMGRGGVLQTAPVRTIPRRYFSGADGMADLLLGAVVLPDNLPSHLRTLALVHETLHKNAAGADVTFINEGLTQLFALRALMHWEKQAGDELDYYEELSSKTGQEEGLPAYFMEVAVAAQALRYFGEGLSEYYFTGDESHLKSQRPDWDHFRDLAIRYENASIMDKALLLGEMNKILKPKSQFSATNVACLLAPLLWLIGIDKTFPRFYAAYVMVIGPIVETLLFHWLLGSLINVEQTALAFAAAHIVVRWMVRALDSGSAQPPLRVLLKDAFDAAVLYCLSLSFSQPFLISSLSSAKAVAAASLLHIAYNALMVFTWLGRLLPIASIDDDLLRQMQADRIEAQTNRNEQQEEKDELLQISTDFLNTYGFDSSARHQLEMLREDIRNRVLEKQKTGDKTLVVYEVGLGRTPYEALQFIAASEETLIETLKEEAANWTIHIVAIDATYISLKHAVMVFAQREGQYRQRGIVTDFSYDEALFGDAIANRLRELRASSAAILVTKPRVRLKLSIQEGNMYDLKRLEAIRQTQGGNRHADYILHRDVTKLNKAAGQDRITSAMSPLERKNIGAKLLALQRVIQAFGTTGTLYVVEPSVLYHELRPSSKKGRSLIDSGDNVPVLQLQGMKLERESDIAPRANRADPQSIDNRGTGLLRVQDVEKVATATVDDLIQAVDNSHRKLEEDKNSNLVKAIMSLVQTGPVIGDGVIVFGGPAPVEWKALKDLLEEIHMEKGSEDIISLLSDDADLALAEANEAVRNFRSAKGKIPAGKRLFLAVSSQAILDKVAPLLAPVLKADKRVLLTVRKDTALELLASIPARPYPVAKHRFLVAGELDLPDNYFDLSAASQELQRSIIVDLILKEMGVIEIRGTHLPNWSAIRQALIAA